MNIFEIASRKKLRFQSAKGALSVEQLWDLPLTSKNGSDLDTIARAVNAELKGVTEESFVAVKPNPMKAVLELQMDIVKYIIAVKLAEAEKAKTDAARADERKKLLEALEAKESDELRDLSTEQIKARLAAL